MLIATIALASVILLGGMMLYTRTSPFERHPHCPNCSVAYITMAPSGTGRSYEVLACPECTNTITRVHGTPSRFAYCPSCQQRTLETPTRRLAPTVEAPLAVSVDERCHICGYGEQRVLPEPSERPVAVGEPRLGKVIPFPER